MISYRKQLAKIGIGPDEEVSYREFYSYPKSLRQAMRSMDAPPTRQWDEASNVFRDEFWTDEIQGVAWNGSHWIFCANARQSKPDVEDKALYVFEAGSSLKDDEWATRLKFKDVPHPIADTTESDDHWGQLTYHEGFVHVAHFWEEDSPTPFEPNVVVFKSEGAQLSFERWVEIERPPEVPSDPNGPNYEFQGINPWDGLYYMSHGGKFFKHKLDGSFAGEILECEPAPTGIQGAVFTPNGHLYVAGNTALPDDEDYQSIWYYSALNGFRFGVIPVPAFRHYPTDELEGICYADLEVGDGRRAQIHAVLLENPSPDIFGALDNIFFKSFSTDEPEIV